MSHDREHLHVDTVKLVKARPGPGAERNTTEPIQYRSSTGLERQPLQYRAGVTTSTVQGWSDNLYSTGLE